MDAMLAQTQLAAGGAILNGAPSWFVELVGAASVVGLIIIVIKNNRWRHK